MAALRILLNGARGRMGLAIQAAAPKHDVSIVSACDQGDDACKELDKCDVVIDFSFHAATVPLLEAAVAKGKPFVIGTTGHTEAERAAIRKLTEKTPVVWAGNYSIGVNLLLHLTETAARILPRAHYAAEITEIHHRHKLDAPSGTAENLLSAIRSARPTPDDAIKHGREGICGPRTEEEIAVLALRGGDVVGEHTVFFFGEGERIELKHQATNRAIFAEGAITAAKWVIGKPPGLYDMRDVLKLK